MKMITAVVIAAALALGSMSADAQQPERMQQMDPTLHRELMPTHVKLMEEQKRHDAEIEKLLAEVNGATGDRRVDALVAVVNKLVEQRREMQAKILARLDH